MRRTRQVAAILLVVTVVLAGCSGGTQTTVETTTTESTPTTATSATPTDSATAASSPTAENRETVRVVGGDLAVDETEVFYRVQRLLGTDAEPQPVEVRNLTERKGYRPGQSPFLRDLGMKNVTLDSDEPGGLTTTTGKVYVYPGDGSPAAVERVLAHEFVHTTQYRASLLPWLSAIDRPRLTHDLLQTRLALVEGGAVYATDAYAERYLDDLNPAGKLARKYENGSPSTKYFYARYHFGHQYVRHRIDSPKSLASVYRSRPNTTEQILHDYSATEEPPAALSVSADASGEWTKTRNNTMGELFTRVVLQTELGVETARSAAAGWGNDVLYGFTSGGEAPGYAWTLRMDSPSEADELAAAAETFAEQRRAHGDVDFRVVRVGDETVVLVLGNPAVVDSVSVSGTTENVTVSV